MTDLTPFFQTLATVSATFCGFLIVALFWVVGRPFDLRVLHDFKGSISDRRVVGEFGYLRGGQDESDKKRYEFDKKRYHETKVYLAKSIVLLATCSVLATLGTFFSVVIETVDLGVGIYLFVSCETGAIGLLHVVFGFFSLAREENPKVRWYNRGGFLKSEHIKDCEGEDEALKRFQ